MPTTARDEAPLALTEEEAQLVSAEAASAAEALEEPLRARAARLVRASQCGEIPADLLDILAQVTSASLRGGRARRLYRAEGEQILTRVLHRTPAGHALQQQLDEVNTALQALAGRSLHAAKVGMRTPGTWTLSLQSDGFAVTLAVGPDAVTLESLST